ncbi:hypothetical protein D9M68_897680 [compost metagenome]
MLGTPELDHRLWLVAAVFQGVAQQVFQRDARELRVAPRRQPLRDVAPHLALRVFVQLFGQDAAHQLAQVDALALQRCLTHAGQRQQRGDERAHACGGRQHPVEHLALVGTHALTELFVEQTGEAVDGAQG